MKLVAVYKSPKRTDTYLYLAKKNDFAQVPAALLSSFGKPEFVFIVPVNKPRNLGGKSSVEIIQQLEKQGYALQIAANETDLLALHRQTLGLGPIPDIKF